MSSVRRQKLSQNICARVSWNEFNSVQIQSDFRFSTNFYHEAKQEFFNKKVRYRIPPVATNLIVLKRFSSNLSRMFAASFHVEAQKKDSQVQN